MTKNTQSCSITLRFKVFWQRKVQPSGSGGFEPLIQGRVNKMTTRIIGTGSYVPEQIVTNDDLSKIVDTMMSGSVAVQA